MQRKRVNPFMTNRIPPYIAYTVGCVSYAYSGDKEFVLGDSVDPSIFSVYHKFVNMLKTTDLSQDDIFEWLEAVLRHIGSEYPNLVGNTQSADEYAKLLERIGFTSKVYVGKFSSGVNPFLKQSPTIGAITFPNNRAEASAILGGQIPMIIAVWFTTDPVDLEKYRIKHLVRIVNWGNDKVIPYTEDGRPIPSGSYTAARGMKTQTFYEKLTEFVERSQKPLGEGGIKFGPDDVTMPGSSGMGDQAFLGPLLKWLRGG